MLAAFRAMAGEPWCLTPGAIGKLTDWQIWELYVKPAVDRQREAKRGTGSGKRKRDPFDGIPSRADYISGAAHFGIPEEHAAAEFDKWAATDEGRRMCAKRAEIEARLAAKATGAPEGFE